MNVKIQKLSTGEVEEFLRLIEIFNLVFENEGTIPSSDYLQKLLSKEDFFVVVAMVENKVVGGLTVYTLHSYYEEKPNAFIYDVGVEPSFQGKGIGKLLIQELKSYCQKNGFSEAFVEAEGDDIDAIEFYRKTKPDSEMVAYQFTYTFD